MLECGSRFDSDSIFLLVSGVEAESLDFGYS